MAAKSSANEQVLRTSIGNAVPLIRQCIAVQRPVFMHGPPGIGKSAIGQQLADEDNRPLIDVRLSLYDPSDLKGIPHLGGDGAMHWSQPHELPRAGRKVEVGNSFHRSSLLKFAADGETVLSTPETEQSIRMLDQENAILFLDEMNSAASSVQAAAYQLMLDRRIGEYELPKNVALLAAGNRANDRGVTNRIPAPLANRMAHIEIEPIFADWAAWAATVGIKPEIIGFLTANQGSWNTFETAKESVVFATPRSWDFISRTLPDNCSTDLARSLTAMYVGLGIAQDFAAYRELALAIPDFRRIFRGENIDVKGLPINIMYTLVYNLMYGLRDMVTQYGQEAPETAKAADATIKFAGLYFQPELAILTSRLLNKVGGVRINRRLTPSFDDHFWPKVSKYVA